MNSGTVRGAIFFGLIGVGVGPSTFEWPPIQHPDCEQRIEHPVAGAGAVEQRERSVLPEPQRAFGVDRLVGHDPEPAEPARREPVEHRRQRDDACERYTGASKSASQRVRSGSIGNSCSIFAFSSNSSALSRVSFPFGTNGQYAPRLNP